MTAKMFDAGGMECPRPKTEGRYENNAKDPDVQG